MWIKMHLLDIYICISYLFSLSVKIRAFNNYKYLLIKWKAWINIVFFYYLVREYRDIPPYRDNGNDEEYISVNSNDDFLGSTTAITNNNSNKSRLRENNDALYDYESTSRNNLGNDLIIRNDLFEFLWFILTFKKLKVIIIIQVQIKIKIFEAYLMMSDHVSYK